MSLGGPRFLLEESHGWSHGVGIQLTDLHEVPTGWREATDRYPRPFSERLAFVRRIACIAGSNVADSEKIRTMRDEASRYSVGGETFRPVRDNARRWGP